MIQAVWRGFLPGVSGSVIFRFIDFLMPELLEVSLTKYLVQSFIIFLSIFERISRNLII